MYTGKLVFAQLMGHLPLHTFRRCVARHDGNRKIQRFTCLDQYLCMAFAQLTYRESLRDVEACLRAQRSKLYHMGFSGLDLPGKSGGTSDSIIATGGLHDEQAETRIYAGV